LFLACCATLEQTTLRAAEKLDQRTAPVMHQDCLECSRVATIRAPGKELPVQGADERHQQGPVDDKEKTQAASASFTATKAQASRQEALNLAVTQEQLASAGSPPRSCLPETIITCTSQRRRSTRGASRRACPRTSCTGRSWRQGAGGAPGGPSGRRPRGCSRRSACG